MAFNGVGVFVRVYQWVQDAANGIFVDATRTDTDSNDIAAGLTNCVTRDGQSPWTANLPAGGFKITGLAAGVNPTDSINYGQVFTSPTFTGTATFQNITGTGVIDFGGATSVTVPTVVVTDNSTNAASTAYVTQKAFQSALPAQQLGVVRYNGTTVDFSVTFDGFAVNEVKGADIASAATINLTTATGNLVHVTGTTTITAITIPSGAERQVVFDGILTLTHNATTLILPTGANITTAAGDSMTVRGDGSGNARVVDYQRADGRALAATPPGLVKLAGPTTPAAANTLDFLTTFSANAASYNCFRVLIEGFKPSADDSLIGRLANGGAVDAGSKYFDSIGFSTDSTASTTFSVSGGATVASAGKGMSITMDFMNMNDVTNNKQVLTFAAYDGPASAHSSGLIASFYDSANAVSGFRLLWTTGSTNFATVGSITIFGYNKT